MAVTQYIGSRYVPLFADPMEWSNDREYEPLTVVLHEGNSFTSKQFVPVGINITNEEFWAETGNYNAQVEAYRRETARVAEDLLDISNLIPANEFTSEDTVKDYIDENITLLDTAIDNISDVIPASNFDDTNTVKKYIDDSITELEDNISTIKGGVFSNITEGVTEFKCWFPIPDAANHVGGDGCMITDNLWLQTFPHKQAANDGLASFIDYSTNTIVTTDPINIGHANGCAYDPYNKYLYVTPGNHGSLGVLYDVVRFDVDSSNKTLSNRSQQTVAWIVEGNTLIPTSIAFDKVTRKLYLCDYNSGYMCEYDYATNTVSNTVAIDKILTQASGNQGTCVHDGIMMHLMTGANQIKAYTINGSQIGNKAVNGFSDLYINNGEGEGMDVYNDIVFLSAYLGTTDHSAYRYMVLQQLTAGKVKYDNYFESLYFNLDANIYTGDGKTAGTALPSPDLLTNIPDGIFTNACYIAGDFTNFNGITLNSNNAKIVNLQGVTHLVNLDIVATDFIRVYYFKPSGTPVSPKNNSIYINGCGVIQMRYLDFSDENYNRGNNDIYINGCSMLTLNNVTPYHVDQNVKVARQTSCVIAAPNNTPITGSTAPTLY